LQIHFGYEFVYSKFALVPGKAFPAFLTELSSRVAPYLGGYLPTQATVSIYPPRCGIPHHVDVKEFGPYIASLSLNSGASMHFRKASAGPARSPQIPTRGGEVGTSSGIDYPTLDGASAGCVYLAPRSLLSMQGESRELYTHAIKGRAADMANGKLIPRVEERISIVWRSHAIERQGGFIAG
jgi:alkylated DNA repair dioxygenase AlkB